MARARVLVVDDKENMLKLFERIFEGNREAGDYELTAAAVSTLHSTGIYESQEAMRGLGYMRAAWTENPWKASANFEYYGNFYAAQAVYQAGGEYWQGWFPKVRDYLVRQQAADGSWTSDRGNVYATAVCVLILQIPYNYLPIFQR